MKKETTRKIAILMAALTIVSAGAGMITGVAQSFAPSAVTAHAANVTESVTFTRSSFSGLPKAASGGSVYYNDTRLKTFTGEELDDSVTVSGIDSEDTDAYVVVFNVGNICYTYSLKTQKLLVKRDMTDQSSIVLNKNTIPYIDELEIYQIIASGNDLKYSTETAELYIDPDFAEDSVDSFVFEKYNPAYNTYLQYTYGDHLGEFCKYVKETGVWMKTGFNKYETLDISIKPENFPLAKGCTGVEFQYDDDIRQSATAAEFEAGTVQFKFRVKYWETATLTFKFDNGVLQYDFIGPFTYLARYSRHANSDTQKDVPTSVITENSSDADASAPHNVHVYEGDIEVADFDSGKVGGNYVLENYDPEKDYYLKVDSADHPGDAVWYKYNPETGEWDFMIDTFKTPEYSFGINTEALPEIPLQAGAAVYNAGSETRTPDYYGVKDPEKAVSKDAFLTGTGKVTVPSNQIDKYTIVVNSDDGSQSVYQPIGTDLILVSRTGNTDEDKAEIPITARPGATLEITGTTEDGTPYSKEVDVTEDTGSVFLPDGEYTITDKATGISNEIVVDNNFDGTHEAGTDVVGDGGKAVTIGEDGKPVSGSEHDVVVDTVTPNTAEVIVKAKKNDTLHVEGEKENGTPYSADIPADSRSVPVTLPDGEYTVSGEATGLGAKIIVDRDLSEPHQEGDEVVTDNNRAVNIGKNGKAIDGSEHVPEYDVATPKEEHSVKVFDDEGNVIGTGTFDDATGPSTRAEAGLSKAISSGTYPAEFTDAVTNKIDAETGDFAEAEPKTGFVIVNPDGSVIRVVAGENGISENVGIIGDVNLDGKVNVSDAVFLQKYLHGVQSFGTDNFINADINADGKVNIFDFVALKKNLLKK